MPDRLDMGVLVIDDEPAARDTLSLFLQAEPDVRLLDTCGDGFSALKSIETHRPDLLFLDIQMPEMTGLELLERIPEPRPFIIFVTAFDAFAVKAFEEKALDYILKPFNRSRFKKSLERARQALRTANQSDQTEQIRALVQALHSQERYLKKIPIKQKGRTSFVPVERIIWIESEGAYTKLHLDQGFTFSNYSIKQLEDLLDPSAFLRVHKSHMVNIDKIKSLQSYFHGEYILYLEGNIQLKLSRGYKDRLEKIMNQYN